MEQTIKGTLKKIGEENKTNKNGQPMTVVKYGINGTECSTVNQTLNDMIKKEGLEGQQVEATIIQVEFSGQTFNNLKSIKKEEKTENNPIFIGMCMNQAERKCSKKYGNADDEIYWKKYEEYFNKFFEINTKIKEILKSA